MVQIRNVSSEFHRRLKARAAIEGMSMSEYSLAKWGKRWIVRRAKRCLNGFRGDRFDTSSEAPQM